MSSPDVTTKYQTAAGIVNKALQMVIDACVVGADIAELCEKGDKFIEEECGKVYNKKEKGKGGEGAKINKGCGSPTCISPNDLLGHFTPLKGESKALAEGQLIKIDMACQIDGFVAAVGHSMIVGDEEVTDKRADVMHAAWLAAEAALRMVQVGKKNTDVTGILKTCSTEFKTELVVGVMSHQMKKHVIHGNKVIAGKENSEEEKVKEFEFEQNEVYCIDVMMSSGEGTGRCTDLRSTVYKRDVEMNYMLKTAKARQFISEVNKRFPTMPFSLRAFEDESMARVGVSEAKRHELLHEYPVLREREGEFVAQFKYTVLLLPGGTKRVTGLPFGKAEKQCKPSFPLGAEIKSEELKKVLATSANPKKAKKKKEAKESEKAEK